MRRSFGSIVDVDVLGLGQHEDAGGAGVDAALRLGDRHPLDAVDAAFVLQPCSTDGAARSRGPSTATTDVLVAAEVGLGGVESLGLPALPLGVAQVHPQQVAGEQRRLVAALARLDLEDDVLVVVGILGQQLLCAGRRSRSSSRVSSD